MELLWCLYQGGTYLKARSTYRHTIRKRNNSFEVQLNKNNNTFAMFCNASTSICFFNGQNTFQTCTKIDIRNNYWAEAIWDTLLYRIFIEADVAEVSVYGVVWSLISHITKYYKQIKGCFCLILQILISNHRYQCFLISEAILDFILFVSPM